MRIVVLGLSITSSWGNGHATTWRALVKALAKRGHEVAFLERDVPWYAANRDLPRPPWCETILYGSVGELADRHAARIASADLVVVGSFVPDGIEAIDLVQSTAGGTTAFYDIDTPVTLAALAAGGCAYLAPRQIPGFDLHLSFTGGPTLRRLESEFGARRARALYCSVDPDVHGPRPVPVRWDMGYLGTYGADRQPMLDALLTEPARRLPAARFAVAGAQYPDAIAWPPNVERIEHLPPSGHAAFYAAQRLTLNVTRADMAAAGWSPSVRLFEAAACGTPILSDAWDGLEELFRPGAEILVGRTADDALEALSRPDAELRAVGERARARVLSAHTADHRAAELEGHVRRARSARRRAVPA
jgi:spore maturation protein CgeB